MIEGAKPHERFLYVADLNGLRNYAYKINLLCNEGTATAWLTLNQTTVSIPGSRQGSRLWRPRWPFG